MQRFHYTFVLFTGLMSATTGLAQDVEAPNELPPAPVEVQDTDREVFVVVEQMPEFPGGQQALMKYMSSHLKYPEIAKEEGIQGKVFINFVVQEDGSLREVKVLRGVHPSLDQEAMRVVKSMPLWNPGKNNGKVCCVQYNLPVMFKLTE
jgi:periplasmic protein TonB